MSLAFILELPPSFSIDWNGFNKVLTHLDNVRGEVSIFFLDTSMRSNDCVDFRKGFIDFDDLGRGVPHCHSATPDDVQGILLENKGVIDFVYFVKGVFNFILDTIDVFDSPRAF